MTSTEEVWNFFFVDAGFLPHLGAYVPPPVITVTFERTCIPDRGVARRLRTFQVRGALRTLRSGRRMRSLRHRTSDREH